MAVNHINLKNPPKSRFRQITAKIIYALRFLGFDKASSTALHKCA